MATPKSVFAHAQFYFVKMTKYKVKNSPGPAPGGYIAGSPIIYLLEPRQEPKIMLESRADVSRMLRESKSFVVFKWAFYMKIAMVILQVIT